MTITAATLVSLLLVIASVSAARIIRLHLPWNKRIPLLVLRFFLLALIVVSFIEPVMVLEQVPASRGTVPVLIDVSKSMFLFQRDSAISRGLAQLEAWNAAHAGERQKFVFYGFGDSLVPLGSSVRSIQWSHRHSYLPESITDTVVRGSNALLLISDGNWSNTTVPSGFFSDKNVYYLPLKYSDRRAYLQMTLPGFPAVSTVDSPVTASIMVEGVSGSADNTLKISVMEKNRGLEQRTISLPAGFFKQEVKINLKNVPPGRHLYRFSARLLLDSLNIDRYALHSKLPKQFFYATYNTNPTLDARFIRLALKRQSFFVESAADKISDADLIVFFDWDPGAQKLLADLKPRGIGLFIGALPCAASVFNTARSQLFRPLRQTVSDNPFDDLDLNRLPPPSNIVFCKALPVLPQNVFLATANQYSDRPGPDTLNVLFAGRFNSRDYIACATGEIWRWDFLPLAVEPDEGRVFNFSEHLIAFTKEKLIDELSEELYLYPEAGLTESDSLRFQVVFPVGLPAPVDISFLCKLTSLKNGDYDTAFTLKSTGQSRETVRFKPLPSGAYRLEASATADNRRYAFADSVFVEEDRSEYMVHGQNTALLQEIAQPVSDLSAGSINALFFGNSSEVNQSVTKTVHFNRSWPLLLLIFSCFAAEWILRRVWKLE